jgi:hypothetical protein
VVVLIPSSSPLARGLDGEEVPGQAKDYVRRGSDAEMD